MILSVVIPTCNKRDLLARTLAALRVQQPGTDAWQIVVVNDGSTDDTARLLDELAAEDPRLVVVSPPRNVGRAAARNLGWQAASGRWVLFLDDDILAPVGLLKAHLEILERDPSHGTIGPAVTDPSIVDGPHFHYLDTRGVAKLPHGPAPGKYLVTQNAAVPRNALERIGGFDEEFAAYGFEDMALGFRLEDSGVHFQVLPTPVPLHIHHHTLAEYLGKKRICGHGSLQQIAERHPHRLAEMRLHLIVDPPGNAPEGRNLCLRQVLRGSLGRFATTLAGAWPWDGQRPLLSAGYFRCMDVAVLSAFCSGLADDTRDAAV